MHTLSRPTHIGNLFLALALLSSPLALAQPEIWYGSDGTIVKVGNHYLTEKEAFGMALRLKAQNQPAQPTQLTPTTQPAQTASQTPPAQALPLTPASVAEIPSQPAQPVSNSLAPVSSLGLYYSNPAHQFNSRSRSYSPYYSSYPASYYYHYSPSVYRSPSLYHRNYYRPRTTRINRTNGWRGFYQNNNGHSHRSLGYQGNRTSIRITR